ncbi:TetR/AcrR family transcriptional regulator [Lysinibacter cavernae]|uniref:AcrR family transcriptional regulator n=1 Tax=Lysinibacter cavernae TaxID=1640652 RepID=A0A7X5TSQ5_9MICO|nr:TetR/AcrR family transcriptional regulator [Lysinibacter cavernae]NIH52478.1 AcrR family transcriptional regulator [Lysinibacter cavernae]
MGRNPKYSTNEILDAARTLIARGGVGAATVVAIAAELGAPSGSIYHRFPSRDLIIAQLWIRTVQRFQAGYVRALRNPDRMRARSSAVRYVLQWSAENPSDAGILLSQSRTQLLATWPNELGSELVTLNDEVAAAMSEFVKDWFGSATPEAVGRARFALIELPYAAVRAHLTDGEALNGWAIDAVVAASAAILKTEG